MRPSGSASGLWGIALEHWRQSTTPTLRQVGFGSCSEFREQSPDSHAAYEVVRLGAFGAPTHHSLNRLLFFLVAGKREAGRAIYVLGIEESLREPRPSEGGDYLYLGAVGMCNRSRS